MKIELICEKCKKKFIRYESATSKRNFCSYRCFQQYRYGRTLNHDFFEEICTEEKSYWLGFLYADGNVSNKNRKQKTITLALASKDKEHVSKFAKIFGGSVREYDRDGYLQSICSVTSREIWEDLVDKGLVPNKTIINDNKIFNFIPKTLERDFVRGFFDGDGGISINKKTNGICLHMIGTEKILLGIRDIIVKNTFIHNVELFPKKNVKNMFVLSWSGIQQLEAIRKFLYDGADIYLDRKFDRFEIIKNRYDDFLKNRKNKFRGTGKSGNKFMATIYHEGKSHYLGTFNTEIEAAKEYDKAIVKYAKPLYRLNFPIEK